MYEAVTSGEKVVVVEEEKRREEEEEGSGGGELKGLMRWEKFLPKMVLRVLLVEADDSTRQIIAALLRKCNFKVAAVPDGLKAWEILKGRPRNFDLILTEVDLPAISGYALLTLIMEHETCKNIPVIMMSSQDSVSTVYKCMLRGAADYLVKPLRKNELRNLWQHVWRRQSSTASVNAPQDESVAQQKVEATAENNAASNRSGGDAACIQRNKELIEKGSDAQSSCTKPELEAESSPVNDMQEFSPLKCGEAHPSGARTQDVDTCIQLGQTSITHDTHVGGLTAPICKNGETSTANVKDGDPEHFWSTSNSVNSTGMFDFSPQLDLSLRGSHASNFDKELTEERHTLMHSNASAFKRYTNRQLEASPAVLSNFFNQLREQRTNNEKIVSHVATGCNSDCSTPSMQRCMLSSAAAQSKESELATSHSNQGHSLPIPVKGVRFNDLHTAYGSSLPPVFQTQSGPSPMPSSVLLLEPNFQVNAFYQSNGNENSSEQLREHRGPYGNSNQEHIVYPQEHRSERAEDRGYISPATDQSVSSNFCNGNANHLNSNGYGNNCVSSSRADQVATVRAASDGKHEDLTNNGYTHRSIQREAALNKFRLKRKERCYEKKVRYESRKKLAEQRPRVKGQFVRQANPDPLAAEQDGQEYDQ
ncbi:two-component response regulator-like APRR5 isoform X2 [Lotus japonicus]|uniref:two-component response regulator-like APRR5 isoform X2 n=1 Tax=Lotus japonicus TaxID=34305 RepID=UPI00258FDB2C|nr:two-component response regulator-like APRR5 isoform X2 [Lotus japonicus]